MRHGIYFEPDDCDLDLFRAETRRELDPASVPQATEIARNIPIYDMGVLRGDLADPERRRSLMGEWAQGLAAGAGALVLRGAYADTRPIDAATQVYLEIIERERGRSAEDHFAAKGANDRIWNSLQKLCQQDPATFAAYFGNVPVAAVCEAWLGPGYQMTAQVNLVRPGGQAQTAHRDYHLGFQSEAVALGFPAQMHDLSPYLTLQGAVAHCDMPIESGTTKLLPFSQTFRPGYLAYRRPEFAAYFEEACVQLPLAKGDALFFSPALFHGAGANQSADIQRMANLLQVSSALGVAMENIDRAGMCRTLFPVLQTTEPGPERAAAIAAAAYGYSFPTNLDTDPPKGGLAPETQAALLTRALDSGMSATEFDAALAAQEARRHA